MYKELMRYLRIGDPVELIYMDSGDKITERRVKLISITDDKIKLFCYTRNAPRTFLISNILAIAPIHTKRGRTA